MVPDKKELQYYLIGGNVSGDLAQAPIAACPPPFIDDTITNADVPHTSGMWEADWSTGSDDVTVTPSAVGTVRIQHISVDNPRRPWMGHYNNPCTAPDGTTEITFAYVAQVDQHVFSQDIGQDSIMGAYIAQRKSGGSFTDLGAGAQVSIADGVTGDTPVSYNVTINVPGSDAGGGQTWTSEFFVSFDMSPDSVGAGQTFDADILLKNFEVTFA